MTYEVISGRLAWPVGTLLTVRALAGCNIGALVQGGHLVPVPDKPIRKQSPAKPVETADEPKEL